MTDSWPVLYQRSLRELERLEELLDLHEEADDADAFLATWDLYCEEINFAVLLARRAVNENHFRAG